MIRPGLLHTCAAGALIVATGIALERTATAADEAVDLVVVAGMTLGLGFLLLGSSRWIGVASGPMVGAVMLEAGFGNDPSWVRAVVIGCLWFAALEMSWEAIDRRQGALHTRAANASRLQEVALVIALSLALGLVAVASASLAPIRSVLLQALLIGALLGAFVVVARNATTPEDAA